MAHVYSMCCSSTLNPQVLFYDDHISHFYDRLLNILHNHNIQSFILKSGYSVYDQQNYNGPKSKINNFYGGTRMN